MYTSELDKNVITDIDKDEVECVVQINFTTPKNVLNNNYFYWGDQKIQMEEVGDYESG